MATEIDMSLDDIITKNKENRRGRGRGRRGRGLGGRGIFVGTFVNGRMNSGRGGSRRGRLSVSARSAQFGISKPIRRVRNLPWQHDLLEDSIRAAGITGVEIGTKLYISNLDHGVSNDDIRDLFSEIGELKRYTVHYDKSGRSTGSAEVVYARRSDAVVALKKYNNVLLDGKSMKIEILGSSSDNNSVAATNGIAKRTTFSGRSGRGRGVRKLKSADQLDKELENYHAMQT